MHQFLHDRRCRPRFGSAALVKLDARVWLRHHTSHNAAYSNSAYSALPSENGNLQIIWKNARYFGLKRAHEA